MVWSDDFIRRDSNNIDNLFLCQRARLNFTEDPEYVPSLPLVSNTTNKWKVTADLWTYIDDIIIISSSEEEAWLVVYIIVTYYKYLGIRYATKKDNASN